MQRIILGIHGLGNKPPSDLLKSWWVRSINEGLSKISSKQYSIDFELVYWADILHPQPLDPRITNKEDPYFLEESYQPALENVQPESKSLKQKLMSYLETQIDKIFLNDDMSLNFESVTDKIIHLYFKDLETYYSDSTVSKDGQNVTANEAIRQRLRDILFKNRNKEILLIAHSMGSIIAYDVLSDPDNVIPVHTFITIGSPLGIPPVVSKIIKKQNNSLTEKHARTPENVKNSWYNFSDPEDKVALDHTLQDDFAPNSHGIRAEDKLVFNDYMVNNERNPHKAYGYLRSAEMAEVIARFIDDEKVPRLSKLADSIFGLLKKFKTKLFKTDRI